MSITQGGQYNSGKMGIIKQGFTSGNREGFVGILGSNNQMDQVITTDTATTTTGTGRLNDNVKQYGKDYKTLRGKTKEYIDALPANRLKTNYNVFVNRSLQPEKIPAKNQKQCVTASSISNLTLASGFAASYPDNFKNFTEVNNACKFWASNAGNTTYAVKKNKEGNYQCFTGNDLNSTIIQKSRPAKIYTVLEGDAMSYKGGLFANGQIGVWSGSFSSAASKNKKPMTIKKYNSNAYSTRDKPIVSTVQSGWWGNSTPGTSNNWGLNKFPNSTAWWIGNLSVENNPNASFIHWQTNGTSYFYYSFNNTVNRALYIYYVSHNEPRIKVMGTTINMTLIPNSAYNPSGWTGGGGWEGNTSALPAGNMYIEVTVPTGLPNSGFVFYAATQDKNTVLFKSGDDGWFVLPTPMTDTSFTANPMNMKTVNSAPAAFNKCDPIVGGGVMKSSIKASYGRNCSNVSQPFVNIRYVIYAPSDTSYDYFQIASLAINAFVNGSLVNVAPRGKIYSDYYNNISAASSVIDGKLDNELGYVSSRPVRLNDNNIIIDLGKNYPVAEVVYYNLKTNTERADGTRLLIMPDPVTNFALFTLTSELRQSFTVSPDEMYHRS
jgi:hypothetical protein